MYPQTYPDNMPTKEEIKAKYGIKENDFKILTRLPTKEEQEKEGGILIKLGQAFGAQDWMWKSVWGVLLAIIIIPAAAQGVWNFWQPKAIYGFEMVSSYIQTFDPKKQTEDQGFVAFTTQYEKAREDSEKHEAINWPTGSMVVPISGSGLG
jgi:hypothetical protein